MTTGSWGRSDADVWTCTYRLFRVDGSLVYVGVTDDFESRMGNHSRRHWWPEVASKDVIWFPDRLSALYEESRAIDFENPTYNDREGISPFGIRPLSCPGAEQEAVIVTRYGKDRFFTDYAWRGRPAELTHYGAGTGTILVPIAWYKQAKECLGEPLDMGSMPTCSVDKL
jgi:GIY-YIG catalytic domain-containing protein